MCTTVNISSIRGPSSPGCYPAAWNKCLYVNCVYIYVVRMCVSSMCKLWSWNFKPNGNWVNYIYWLKQAVMVSTRWESLGGQDSSSAAQCPYKQRSNFNLSNHSDGAILHLEEQSYNQCLNKALPISSQVPVAHYRVQIKRVQIKIKTCWDYFG